MAFDMVKYERGQIWKIYFKNQEAVGHEQKKDRPWIILSIGRFNKSSGMFTAAPISTGNSIRTPSQVLFENDLGHSNIILCEQIRSFDHTSGWYKLEYLGQASTEVLEKVDVALSIHLGMHYSPVTLDNLYKSIEAVVKSVKYTDSKKAAKFSDDDVINFATKLIDVAGPINEDPQEVTTVVDTADPIVIKEDSIVEKVTILKPVEKPKKRISWTTANCEKFLSDVENMPMKEVMEKWGISKKTRFYSTKNYVQNLMMKRTEE